MSCAFKDCKSHRRKKEQGVTFHKFPTNDALKSAWVAAVEKGENWKPCASSVVCSKHFFKTDFDRQSTLRVYLKNGAVPVNKPSTISSLRVHFEDSMFKQNHAAVWKQLKPNAIPTLFSVTNLVEPVTPQRVEGFGKPKPGFSVDVHLQDIDQGMLFNGKTKCSKHVHTWKNSSAVLDKRMCFLCKTQTKPLFTFPHNVKRQLLWLKSIGKEDLLQIEGVNHKYIYNNGRLCALHFKEQYFTSTLKKKLCIFAVPHHLENGNQTSVPEFAESASENSSSFQGSGGCNSVKNINLSTSQIGKNSSVISFTALAATLQNESVEKESLVKATPSLQNIMTLSNGISKEGSPVAIVSSSKTGSGSINKMSEKTSMAWRAVKNVTSSDMVKDPAVTVITLCCTDRKEGTAFHKFLQDPKQRMRWISAVKGNNSRPTHISVLCPKHFNEEQVKHPSAVKENTVPNVYALDVSSQQKDIKCSQKGNEVPMPKHCGEVTKDGELHNNATQIDKVYVKVMYDETAVGEISKRHFSQSRAADVGARKKLKTDKICSSGDPNNLSNISMLSSKKTGKESENHVKAGETEKHSLYCSSDTNPSKIENFKCLQQTPTEEPVKDTVASEISQKEAIDSSSDTNFSDPPDLPLDSPQSEDSVSHVELKENLENDVTVSSSNNKASTHPDVPIHLPRKARKRLVLYARNKLRKPLVMPSQEPMAYPPLSNIKNVKTGHSLSDSGVKITHQNSVAVSENKEKIDSQNSSSGNVRTYRTTGTEIERRDLTDFSTQTDLVEVSDSNYSSTGNITHSSTQTDLAEVIDSNYSTIHIQEEITDPCDSDIGAEQANFIPKIVNVIGGIDPFNLLEITEMKNLVKVPNEWWGITCTPKYLLCSKWNEDYDPVYRVIIDKDYNAKIFIKSRECVNEGKKVSLENISALLEEVDSYEICAGVSDKSMTKCMGHLESQTEGPFSIWCKGCQEKGKELMNRYKNSSRL